MESKGKVPGWMTAVIIVCMLPALVICPLTMSKLPPEGELRFLTMLYPAYVVADALCAWICYKQRPELTWILLVLMMMAHAGIYYLAG